MRVLPMPGCRSLLRFPVLVVLLSSSLSAAAELAILDHGIELAISASAPCMDHQVIHVRWSTITQDPGRRISLPKIGAGLAGGDWSRISDIMDRGLAGEDLPVVQYEVPSP